ncbi:MAG: DUF721 domain-containing protein [Candidatus Omnitrophica bacterium]|nr:DUF721 domain-containing protein [Candidatus Omnitrophota bacterium]MDD5488723.1 DUF721 domain-containing protein [Candidatus Omnitrophota bacterium]
MVYDRTRHVSGIIDGLIKKWQTGSSKKAKAIHEAWVKAVGEKKAAVARPVDMKKGTLVVIVKDSPWLYSLTMEKKQTLAGFNKEYTGRIKAKDIRFRVGKLDM